MESLIVVELGFLIMVNLSCLFFVKWGKDLLDCRIVGRGVGVKKMKLEFKIGDIIINKIKKKGYCFVLFVMFNLLLL